MDEDPALLVMAVTKVWVDGPDRGDMIGPATGVAKKQNVPPFRGGTCGSFYAHRINCQRATEPEACLGKAGYKP